MTFLDGLSNTLLVGEKQVPIGSERYGGWDCSIFNGDGLSCSSRPASKNKPLTTDPWNPDWLFGSRHLTVVQFAFADGHVQALPVTIDPHTLDLLSNKDDGLPIPPW